MDERQKAWWYQCTVILQPVSAVELVKGAQALSAGEILLNRIDKDGTGIGFDIDLIGMVKHTITIPGVASSGTGTTGHFVDVFKQMDVESALAARIFHRDEVGIQDVKLTLVNAGFNTRLI